MIRTFFATNTYKLVIPGGMTQVTPGPFTIKALQCSSGTGADRWLQIHSGTDVPANGTVPLFTPLLVPNAYVSEELYPDGRTVIYGGLVAVISSTRNTLTVDVAATVDITVDVEEFEFRSPVPLAVSGDYTTSVKQLQMWTEAQGPKTLIMLEMRNSSGGTIYAQLFAKDSPAEGAVPIRSWPIPAGEPLVLTFGPNSGTVPYAQDADGTARKGGTIVFSSTQNTKTLVAANSGTIKGTLK